MGQPEFLPGVPVDYVLQRFALAGGNEVESGKLASPESSAALAANCFAWFAHRPHLLPPFPGFEAAYPPLSVDIEYSARYPWSGGRHSWLDAMITTPAEVIGVDSKRFEPFRGAKSASLSEAYDRPVWGDRLGSFEQLRYDLRSGRAVFKSLDATQFVKHFAHWTDLVRSGQLGRAQADWCSSSVRQPARGCACLLNLREWRRMSWL